MLSDALCVMCYHFQFSIYPRNIFYEFCPCQLVNMHQEKYNLNWHTYSDHLREMLHSMMKSEHLTDVTLVCDDKRKFKAHKMVLSACSSVVKSIIDDLPISNDSVIYLKGIHHQDMESILEFMYLGVATFYQERMNEFLNVANNLEIKEIHGIDYDNTLNNGGIVANQEAQQNDHETTVHRSALKEDSHFDVDTQETYTNSDNGVLESNNLFKGTSKECPDCEKIFASAQAMTTHYNSIHIGIKYGCNQCEFQGTTQGYLTLHIRSKHEGMKYSCNQCDSKFSQPSTLKTHVQSVHEGIKYDCNQCNHQFALMLIESSC